MCRRDDMAEFTKMGALLQWFGCDKCTVGQLLLSKHGIVISQQILDDLQQQIRLNFSWYATGKNTCQTTRSHGDERLAN